MTSDRVKVDDYGDVLAIAYDLEKVSCEEDGGYQGEYLVVLRDDKTKRLFYFTGYYGSCSGCDWLQDVQDWDDGTVSYKDILEYVNDRKPLYIVPENKPLTFRNRGEYNGWEVE